MRVEGGLRGYYAVYTTLRRGRALDLDSAFMLKPHAGAELGDRIAQCPTFSLGRVG
jgi:hypothetical protein